MKKALVLLLVVLMSAPAWAAGIEGIAVAAGGAGIMMGLSKDMTGTVGLAYTSASVGSVSNLGLLFRLENVISKKAPVNTYWGGSIGFVSASAAGASTTTITLNGFVGAEFFFAKNLSLFADINLLTLQSASAGGASSTNISLVNSSGTVYTGGRIYL